MLFAIADTERSPDRIRLFQTPESAQDQSRGDQEVIAVALEVDPQGRRVTPLWTDAREFNPEWDAPVQFHADGSVTARGPIPEPLIVAVPNDARPLLDAMIEQPVEPPEPPAD